MSEDTRGPVRPTHSALLVNKAIQVSGRPTSQSGMSTVRVTGGAGGTTTRANVGSDSVKWGFAHRPSAASVVDALRSSPADQPTTAGGDIFRTGHIPERTIPLVALLITDGVHDVLHRSYLESYVELDRAGGPALVYFDIGHPNVKGPVARELLKAGVLTFDPGDAKRYERAVREAGGETPYRRLEIDRLRQMLGWTEEPAPFLALLPPGRPNDYALLAIPESALVLPRGEARLWGVIREALSESALRDLCAAGDWPAESIHRLQDHLDRISDQLSAGLDSLGGARLVEGAEKSGWEIAFRGTTARLRPSAGLTYLRRLLEQPGKPVPIEELAQERPGMPLPGDGMQRQLAARDLNTREPVSQELADEQLLEVLKGQLEGVRKKCIAAQESGDLDLAHELDEQAADLEARLGTLSCLGGRPRTVANDARRRKESIKRAIHRAIKTIAEACPLAGSHLQDSIGLLGDPCYHPDPPVTWRTR